MHTETVRAPLQRLLQLTGRLQPQWLLQLTGRLQPGGSLPGRSSVGTAPRAVTTPASGAPFAAVAAVAVSVVCCCRRSELCAAASPLARSFFKALQPNCAPSDVSAALLSRHPRARPRFPSPTPPSHGPGCAEAGNVKSRPVLGAPTALPRGGFLHTGSGTRQGTPTCTHPLQFLATCN